MNSEDLVKKYPNLFRDYGGDPRKTCMAWGFSHDKGWYKLLDEIGQKLMDINAEDCVIADQVKEKFGGLRFYYHTTSVSDFMYDKIEKIIRDAEEKSYITCEVCGEPGKMRGQGWLKTLCDDCDKVKDE